MNSTGTMQHLHHRRVQYLAAILLALLRYDYGASTALLMPRIHQNNCRQRLMIAEGMILPHPKTLPIYMFLSTPNTFHRSHKVPQHSTPQCPTSNKASSTSLNLFFDEFIRPYGIFPNNRTKSDNKKYSENEDVNQTQVELLGALLPPIQHFDDGKNGKSLPSSREEAFQRARLAEQLRLSHQSHDSGQHEYSQQSRGQGHQIKGLNRKEAFQRALLKERLRLHQKEKVVTGSVMNDNADSTTTIVLEDAKKEHGGTIKLISIDGGSNDEEDEMECASDKQQLDASSVHKGAESASVDSIVAKNSADDLTISTVPPLEVASGDGIDDENDTVNKSGNKTSPSSQQLHFQLEIFHQMVMNATTSIPATPSANSQLSSTTEKHAIISKSDASSSMKKFLSNTHLPLPPKEDASYISLVLAPLTYTLSSMFLFAATGLYAMCAVMDVLWNDTEDEYKIGVENVDSGEGSFGTTGYRRYCTRSCLKEAWNMWQSCWYHLFSVGRQCQEGIFQRLLESLRISLQVLFYASQCIVMRAAHHSRYANECMDAGTGALRYFVYSLRSIKFLWARVLKSLTDYCSGNGDSMEMQYSKDKVISFRKKFKIKPNTSKPSWKRKLHLFRVLSRIGRRAAKRREQQQALQLQQQRVHFERDYQNKLSLLNKDRLKLERERRNLYEIEEHLNEERRKLLVDSLSVLSWYSAVGEAAEALDSGDKKPQGGKKEKRWRGWWRRHGESKQ